MLPWQGFRNFVCKIFSLHAKFTKDFLFVALIAAFQWFILLVREEKSSFINFFFLYFCSIDAKTRKIFTETCDKKKSRMRNRNYLFQHVSHIRTPTSKHRTIKMTILFHSLKVAWHKTVFRDAQRWARQTT